MRRVSPQLYWCLAVLLLLGSPGVALAQLVTGTITGAVTDDSGGLMPGVAISVSSENLIGGAQTQTSDERGAFRFDNLPPGVYTVKFELEGFNAVIRTDIRISSAVIATVDAKLQVGDLKEAITVSGGAPVVDTRSNVQQTVFDQELLEGVPTGRDVWSVGKLIPGVNVGTYDVGGTQGMQQSAMSAHGSRSDDKTFAIDGLAVNWPGNGGGSTMVYYDQGMFEEVNYQTSAIPAEVSIGGIYMNMVTKSGSNKWRTDARYYYASENMQSENFVQVPRGTGLRTIGNPISGQYDFNATAAGPIAKDKIWFFGSYRRWRVDKRLLAVFNSDGSTAIDDNLIWNWSGKLTAQLSPNHKLGIVYNYNQKDRYHRRDTPPDYVDDIASYLQEQPGRTGQVKYTAVLGGATVYETTIGGVNGVWPLRYQPDTPAGALRREDDTLLTGWGAAPRQYENPNYRLQFDNIVSHNKSGWGGSHAFKGGVQFTRQFFQEINRMNGDMRLIYTNGVPNRVQAFNTSVDAKSYIQQLGFFGQDAWTIGRKLTLNVGVRFDRANGWYPEQTSPAGAWVAERTLQKTDVYKQWLGVWRAGAVYDLRGDGRTAIKGNYSRYAAQVGIDIVTNVHPFTLSSANISWNDRNGDELPQADELGRFEGFTGGASTRYASPNGPKWGYSDEITAGVEHQVLKDVRVGLMYYHRTNRNMIGVRNEAVPSDSYTPVTLANPLGGDITIYNLKPEFVGRQQNVRDNIDLLDNDYDGIELTAVKRFSDRWQMLLGYTYGKNTGGISFGGTTDYNDPNNLVNQQGRVATDAPHSFKLSGSYMMPKADIMVAGSVIRNTGYPRQPSWAVNRTAYPGLTRSSQTIRVLERGDLRLPTVAMLDLRFSRRIQLGTLSVEPQVDLFNLTNAGTFVGIVDPIGSSFGQPTEILAPRLVRVGFVVNF